MSHIIHFLFKFSFKHASSSLKPSNQLMELNEKEIKLKTL